MSTALDIQGHTINSFTRSTGSMRPRSQTSQPPNNIGSPVHAGGAAQSYTVCNAKYKTQREAMAAWVSRRLCEGGRVAMAGAAGLALWSASSTAVLAGPVYSSGAASYSGFSIDVVDVTPNDGQAASWSFGSGGAIEQYSLLRVYDHISDAETFTGDGNRHTRDQLPPYALTLAHALALQHSSSTAAFHGAVDGVALNSATEFEALAQEGFSIVLAPFSRLLLGLDVSARAQGQDHAGSFDLLNVAAGMSLNQVGLDQSMITDFVGWSYDGAAAGWSVDASEAARVSLGWSNDSAAPVELLVQLVAQVWVIDGSLRAPAAAPVPVPGTLPLAVAALLVLLTQKRRRVGP